MSLEGSRLTDISLQMKTIKIVVSIAVFLSISSICANGQMRMTMEEAISRARQESVQALKARSAFVSSYWSWRTYRASRLPSLNAYGNLGSLNRSLTLLQNYETGEMVYAKTYNMQNSLGLSISQIIPFTGGSVSLYSDLARIDQFGAYSNKTWYAQPITLSYSQPLFSFNQYKWDEKISPKEYEKAKRVYIESMENVTIQAVQLYYSLAMALQKNVVAKTNFKNSRKMLAVASERNKLNGISRDDYLQLELKALNDSIIVNETEIDLKDAQMNFCTYIGMGPDEEVIPELSDDLPDIYMDYDFVLDKSINNSSFVVSNEINILNADAAIAQAKANRGLTMKLSARFGLSNSAPEIRTTYNNLLDQEVVGLTFSIPIYDWGLGKGKVKKAEAAAEVIRAQVIQAETEYRRSLFTSVGQFNNQRQQCAVSKRAARIANERYLLMLDKFAAGSATVLELKNAQQENDSAATQYILDLMNYWNYYFSLRQLALYDFITDCDLNVDYREIVE